MEIYFDIITAIHHDKQEHVKLSKTRVQQKSNTSYDKLMRYLDAMEEMNLIKNGRDIEITALGQKFFDDYGIVNNMIKDIIRSLR